MRRTSAQRLLGGLAAGHVEVREDRLELAPQRAVVLQDQELPAFLAEFMTLPSTQASVDRYIAALPTQRAPCPMKTTSAVCSRIARSNNSVLFLM